MKRILKEPLLHFLVLGAALFVAFSFLSNRDETSRGAIVVSAGKIEHLSALFERTWQRPPIRDELEALINDYIREEAAYREGMAVGLDRDDTIIRRRIRQKLEFIAEDLVGQVEPNDDELAAYLAANPDRFRVDPTLTFRQIYFNRGESVENDARKLLTTLNGDPSLDASQHGDRILLEHGYAELSLRDVANLFGPQFATAIVNLELGAWQGPVESGYGTHIVFVDKRIEGRLPELSEIRSHVLLEWDNARRQEASEDFYSELIERYETVIEWPEDSAQEEAR